MNTRRVKGDGSVLTATRKRLLNKILHGNGNIAIIIGKMGHPLLNKIVTRRHHFPNKS